MSSGMFNNTVELELFCGVCGTTLKTRIATSSERLALTREFDYSHKDCRHSFPDSSENAAGRVAPAPESR